MTFKNNRETFLCCFTLCLSFRSHQWIQSSVTMRKRSILVKIGDFFPNDLEIWQMTLKNNRASLLYYFKHCTSFQSHWWIKTGFTVQNRPFGSQLTILLATWPLSLTDDLEKQCGTSPKQHEALCIISSSYVNSNWSNGPETVKFGFVLCDIDLWLLTLTSCMDITSVIGNNDDGNIVKRCEGQTGGRTDGVNHL